MCKPGAGCCGCGGSGRAGVAVVAVAVLAVAAVGAVIDDVVAVAGAVMATLVVVLSVVLVRKLRNPEAVLYRPGQALPVRSRKVIEGRVVPAIEANRQVHSPDMLVQLPDRLV